IARNAGGDRVHDGPLRRGGPPATLGFLARQLDREGEAEIRFQLAAVNEDAAPDNFSGLADSLQGSAAEPEVHGRLALAHGAAIPSDEMLWRHGPGDLEYPYEIGAVGFATAEIVQGGLRIEAQRTPDA